MTKKRRPKPQSQRHPVGVRSHYPAHSSGTSGSEDAADMWTGRAAHTEGTIAPPLDRSGRAEGFVNTSAALADKLLHSARPINVPLLLAGVVVLWLVGVLWLYLQDNGANRLGDWPAIRWFLKKAAVLTGVGAVAVLAILGIVKFHNRSTRVA